jgi:hypothetical protein
MTTRTTIAVETNQIQQSVTFEGRLLPLLLPATVEIQHSLDREGEHYVLRHKAARFDASPASVLCGRLVLPYQRSTRLGCDVATIDVAPPSPWDLSHIRSMWEDLATASIDLGSLTMQGRGTWRTARRRIRPADFAAEAVGRARSAAMLLLRDWPGREDRDIVWRAVDLAGGRELGPTTERALDRRALASGGPLGALPERTARVRPIEPDWQLGAVSSAARLLHDQAQAAAAAATIGELEPWLLQPVEAVAKRARPADNRPDPPPSSWPLRFREFYEAAITAMASWLPPAQAEMKLHSASCGGSTRAGSSNKSSPV